MSRTITEILQIMNELGLLMTRVHMRRLCVVCGGTGCPECFDSDGFTATKNDTKDDTLGA